MGSPVGVGSDNERPQREVTVPTFWMTRSEVTVGQYRACVNAGACTAPNCDNANTVSGVIVCNWSQNRETHPVNYVSWTQMRAFGAWVGADLPTEAQWEFVAAASGRPGRETRYPWGSDEPNCSRAVFARARSLAEGATECAVDEADRGPQALRENEAMTGDVTPTGIVGMGGNVREFTLDDYRPYCSRCWFGASLDDPHCSTDPAALRTVRGGDWAGGEDSLLAGLRDEGVARDAWSPRIGFRCVRPGSAED